ncbi:MAG: sugar phosphate isomerase/epimerase family protein [Thermoproteota archaeon]
MFTSVFFESIEIHGKDLVTKAKLASLGGFDAIHVDLRELEEVGSEGVKQILEEHGLRIGGSFLPFRVTNGDSDFERNLSGLPNLLRVASEVGCERISTWITPFSDALPYRRNFELHAKRLRPVARVLSDYGCRLGLEFIGPFTARRGHRFTFIHTLGEMLKLCDALGEDNAGILLDSWHWYTSRGTLDDLSALSDKDVVDVHLNDAPSGLTPEEQVDGRRALPGETGVIDCVGFLRVLKGIGYQGPVMVEPFYEALRGMQMEGIVSLVSRSLREVWEKT